jgi:phage/plasmid-like protein (TIGR03299 family)
MNLLRPEGGVSLEQAREYLDYPVEKRQAFLADGRPIRGSHALVRGDTNQVIYPSVGERYTLVSNRQLLDLVEQRVLSVYPNILIESVGKFFNGQVAFINLKLDEWVVPRDSSPSISNLMLGNRFGDGSLALGGHTVRIICYNTFMAALAESAANKSLQSIRHTLHAAEKLTEGIIDLTSVYADFSIEKQRLAWLATQAVDTKYVTAYLDALYPLPEIEEEETSRALTIATNRREGLINLFESKEDLQGGIARTRYALFQATTDYLDHKLPARKSTTEEATFWDGLFGNRDKLKRKAAEHLLAA